MGGILCLWAVYVWWWNNDFWDGFVFPWVTGTIGIYQISLGRTALLSVEHPDRPAPAGSAAASAAGSTESEVPSGGSAGLESPEVPSAPSGVGPWASRFGTSVAVSVVSAVIVKMLGA